MIEDILASKEGTTTNRGSDELPFGAMPGESGGTSKPKRRSSRGSGDGEGESSSKTGKKKAKKKKSKKKTEKKDEKTSSPPAGDASKPESQDRPQGDGGRSEEGRSSHRPRRRRRRRRGARGNDGGQGKSGGENREARNEPQRGKKRHATSGARFDSRVETGMFIMEKGDYGALRREAAGYRQSKEDIFVPKHLIKKYRLPEGAIITGPISRGQKHKYQLADVHEVDGEEPGKWKNQTPFKNLTSIDPDFHYAVGDALDNVSMRIVDLLCPIGRGQRGLIVAPPRTGKTTIMREFAAGIEKAYPDVHLMIVLVDERPEEATEWRRSVERAQLYVSTSDETSKIHIQTAEAAWKRACRLVEMGEEVVMLLDSITRLARAYNNQAGSGRTMSGGLDSRAMERPRKLFGSARNTVEAGSLTILGTTLVQTGSRMDQMVFEEFKGTGNMEMVLSRKLADRRIFPAIDVEKAGTRKEEKLFGMRRVKLVHTLRRVLLRMNFIEAMELLITRLSEVDKTDDFLKRFEVDPEA
ncbi:MAG: transcription termination factor Rho [Planctomycetota bacterium]|nr:transcription termination factor Rho [Planctomycetota bacterium]MDP6939286.1 transcription termination factor Rho [Planctomycetota bacterium]